VSACLNTSGVCNLIFIINWIVRDKKYNNVYKHNHIHRHSLIIRNTQNDFDFVFNYRQLCAVVLLMNLMASFTWMGKQKKIISNNKDTAALRLSRKSVDFSWIRKIVTESVNH
jgi:hypothetical protein